MKREARPAGYDFRYVYGNDKLSVKVMGESSDWWGQSIPQNVAKLYYMQDRLGSTVNMTDGYGAKNCYASYNAWGQLTWDNRDDSLTVGNGYRRLYPQASYTGHDYDLVLDLYYAKARMYDAENKRFGAVDPILDAAKYDVVGYVKNPMQLVQYTYVLNNPLIWVDPDGHAAYSVTSYDEKYDLYISPQWLDAIQIGAGALPFFTPANAVGQRLAGFKKIDFDTWAVIGTATNVINVVTDTSIAGWIGTIAEAGTTLADWVVTQDYKTIEAIDNHFDHDIWISDSREKVEEKFNLARALIATAIENGDIKVKKAGDIFGESAFFAHDVLGMITYQYDMFSGEKKIYMQDDYYFQLVCSEKEGSLQEIQELLREIGG